MGLILKRIYGLIILLIAIGYLSYQFYSIEKKQNALIHEILSDVKFDKQKTGGGIKINHKKLPANLVYGIWVETKNNKVIPMVYDARFFNENAGNRAEMFKEFKKLIRVYKTTVNKAQFIVWFNKYNIDFYIRDMLIPLLFILMIYFIGNILILAFLGYNDDQTSGIADGERIDLSESLSSLDTNEFNSYDDSDYIDESDYTREDKVEWQSLDAQLDVESQYKDLWIKNFKISQEFKDNFDFNGVLKLLKFSITPEDYITGCLEIASRYFKWERANVYIAQKDTFVEVRSRAALGTANLKIPVDGLSKGDFYIPLFPYNKEKLFGYFYLRWNNLQPFFISDILFFLKFMFSFDAKNIFVNYKSNQDLKMRLKDQMSGYNVGEIGFIEVDFKDKFKYELNPDDRNVLNMKIFDDLSGRLNGIFLFEIFQFGYGIIGNIPKEEFKSLINKLVINKDQNNYFLSDTVGNKAVTFSAGISFKSEHNRTFDEMVKEAESLLDTARGSGGDQINFGI